MAYSAKTLVTTHENDDTATLNDIEKLKSDIADEFEIVQRLGREMLKRRRENLKMKSGRAPGPRCLHDLNHIGLRLAERLASVHAQIMKLLTLFEQERAPFLSNDTEVQSLTLQHIEHMERSLRRWDNIRYRLILH